MDRPWAKKEAKPQKELDMADAITASGAISADGKTMTLETGVLANLANGAVVVNVGKLPSLKLRLRIRTLDREQTFSH